MSRGSRHLSITPDIGSNFVELQPGDFGYAAGMMNRNLYPLGDGAGHHTKLSGKRPRPASRINRSDSLGRVGGSTEHSAENMQRSCTPSSGVMLNPCCSRAGVLHGRIATMQEHKEDLLQRRATMQEDRAQYQYEIGLRLQVIVDQLMIDNGLNKTQFVRRAKTTLGRLNNWLRGKHFPDPLF